MAEEAGSLYYDLDLNNKKFNEGLRASQASFNQFGKTIQNEGFVSRFSKKMDSVGSSLLGMGAKLTVGVTAPLVLLGKKAVEAASDLEESTSKVNVVFGEQAKDILKWAESSTKSMGLSKQAALEAAGTYGNLFQAFGVGREQAKEMSKNLVQLAADLASFNNTSVDEAILALRSGLSGETEPLKRYGVALSDVRLKEQAFRMGLIKTKSDALDPLAKSQAAYALIMKDTTLAQGDYARTAGGTANTLRTLKEQFNNVAAELGKSLLPIITQLAGKLANVAEFFSKLPAGAKNTGFGLAALAALAGPLITSMGALAKMLSFVTTPLGLIVTSVAALTAAVVWLFNNNEGFREWVESSFIPSLKRLKEKWDEIWVAIKSLIIPIFQALATIISQALWPAIVQLNDSLNGGLFKILGLIALLIIGVVVGAFIALAVVLAGIIIVVLGVVKVLQFLVDAFKRCVDNAGGFNGMLKTIKETIKALTPFINIMLLPFYAFQTLLGQLIHLLAGLDDGFKKVKKTVGGGIGNFVSGLNPFNFRADGGPVNAGEGYIVGEEGPEFFVPNRSGQIISNSDLQATSSSAAGSGAPIYNMKFNLSGVMATDDASLRQVGLNIAEGINQVLRSKGLGEIGGGKLQSVEFG